MAANTAPAYSNDSTARAQRSLKNTALAYLAKLKAPELVADAVARYHAADNMTDQARPRPIHLFTHHAKIGTYLGKRIVDLEVSSEAISGDAWQVAAMSAVCAVDCPDRATVLDAFYAQWKADPNVMNKWFSIQVRYELGYSLPKKCWHCPSALAKVLSSSRSVSSSAGRLRMMSVTLASKPVESSSALRGRSGAKGAGFSC